MRAWTRKEIGDGDEQVLDDIVGLPAVGRYRYLVNYYGIQPVDMNGLICDDYALQNTMSRLDYKNGNVDAELPQLSMIHKSVNFFYHQNRPAPGYDHDLLTRTTWVDAATAYSIVLKGKATGNKCALLLRSHLQIHLFKLGCFQQRHSGKVLILGILCLCLFSVGLKTAVIESDISNLWVEEGGRLSEELEYTESVLGEGYGSSSQIIVQTPPEDSQSKNMLTKESLLLHLQAVLAATQTEVHLFDKVWRLEDICFKATFPTFEDSLMEMMLEKLLPCIIISPLDCFWEGSKVLGPRNPLILPPSFGIDPVSWKNLNPELLISTLESTIDFRLDAVKDTLRRAGITSGYQKKPCLDPFDPECPVTSPNYRSPDTVHSLAPLLTDGCSAFSETYMHWEPDMITGGMIHNRSNVLVSAEAVQTIVQLMGEQELYNYHQGTFTVSSMEWTQDKAKQILEVFQKKFTEAVVSYNNETNVTDSISSFTPASLDELVESFTHISYLRIAIGYSIMLIYTILSLMNFCDAVQSHAGVGIAGVLLVSLTVAAGLGLCSLLRLPFNAATTQIVPFIALGLGVDDMFVMAYSYAHTSSSQHIQYQHQAGELLKRTGCTVLLTSISNSGAFLVAAIVPIPALRIFSLQVGILLLFNLLSMTLVYPAVLSCDSWRKKEYRVDVICCMESAMNTKVRDISVLPPPSPPSPYPLVERGRDNELTVTDLEDNPPQYNQRSSTRHSQHNTVALSESNSSSGVVTVLAPPEYTEYDVSTFSNSGSRQNLTDNNKYSLCNKTFYTKCCRPSVSWLVERFYIPLIEKTWFKVLICVLSLALLCTGVYGITKVKVGMDLTDVVPRGSNEYTFLEAQNKYFGFYDMYIVTKADFQYQLPKNQELLRELHNKISMLDNVIERDNGDELWLDLMVRWLRDLQHSFDIGIASGHFHSSGWHPNATDNAVLAYKLLIQTGDIDNPIDKTQPSYTRLVDGDGFVNSDAFYNYLTAWVYNDLLAYDISQATIKPEAKEWYYVPSDWDLLIPKVPSITFARMPFYLHNLGTTEDIIECIEQIREICDSYVELGLDNYPTGVIFTFWEQYLNIRHYLLMSLLIVIAAVFIIVTVMLMNPLAAFLVTATLAIITSELFGFMGLVGVKLSAVPVVILVISVGVGVEFTIHVMTGFLTCVGDRVLRIRRSLSQMFVPVLHGSISTLLGVLMLAVSEFDFIVRYFFLCFLALVILGIFNGLVFFPVLLSICGPNGDLHLNNPEATSIDPPTPVPSPHVSPVVKPRARRKHIKPKRRPTSDVTLSTISEEPSHCSSSDVVVEPQVNVETSVVPASSSHRNQRQRRRECPMTRVKTKATVTVEVHTDLPSCSHDDDSSPSRCTRSPTKHSRSGSTRSSECTCSESDESETSV